MPTSGSYSFGFPVDVNDRVTGAGTNQFAYAGAWRNSGDSRPFNKDNTWSTTANSTATLAFTDNRVVLYGVLDTSHGSAAVSIDGGAEADGQLPELYAAGQRGGCGAARRCP